MSWFNKVKVSSPVLDWYGAVCPSKSQKSSQKCRKTILYPQITSISNMEPIQIKWASKNENVVPPYIRTFWTPPLYFLFLLHPKKSSLQVVRLLLKEEGSVRSILTRKMLTFHFELWAKKKVKNFQETSSKIFLAKVVTLVKTGGWGLSKIRYHFFVRLLTKSKLLRNIMAQ